VIDLRIGQLYPREMSIYGDRGNIMSLVYRARARDITVAVSEIGRGPAELAAIDLFFIGGGQDQDQDLVARDLTEAKGEALAGAVAQGAALLAVCGGYQLLGSSYTTAQGKRLPGLGLLDMHTEAGDRRMIGNVLVDITALGLETTTLVGFENHAGRTFLGPGLKPLGGCVVGGGNNGVDGAEGVRAGSIIGTYVHGSLLPKNPHLTDHLLRLALRRRHQGYELPQLAADEEMAAHRAMAYRVRREGAVAAR
jgi:CobQ-like glutamine amidotransferase family enzyme